MKHRKIVWLLLVVAAVSFCVQLVVIGLDNVEYVNNMFFYAINILCVICIALAVGLVFQLRWKGKVITSVIAVIIVIVQLVLLVTDDVDNIVSFSPDFSNVLMIKHDTVTGEAMNYRVHYYILARPHERLPDQIEDELGVDWMTQDIAVVTYEDGDGRAQQWVGTYGDRGSGQSYSYVSSEIYGRWQGEDVEVVSGPDGITVRHNGEERNYSSDQMDQYGTIALGLTDGGEARWTIGLGEDFEVDTGTTEPNTGSIILYDVTGNNDSVTLEYAGED